MRDQVEVAGPQVSDAALTKTLATRLAYDRVNQGNVFNLLTVSVANGVATVGGEVRSPADKASALDEVIGTKGVRGVVDRVSVAPNSTYDDALRIRIARAIYRDPVLSRYALDPQAPIRIVVNGGRVGLYGVVDSELDRTVAGMRAAQVFGSFGVENHLVTTKGVSQ